MSSAILLTFSIVSCSVAEKTCDSSDGSEVLSAQAVAQAESMYAAQSALEATQRGDAEAAKVILENQIRQGFNVLSKLKPLTISGNGYSDQDRKSIDAAMQSAEKYARDHKLVLSPK